MGPLKTKSANNQYNDCKCCFVSSEETDLDFEPDSDTETEDNVFDQRHNCRRSDSVSNNTQYVNKFPENLYFSHKNEMLPLSTVSTLDVADSEYLSRQVNNQVKTCIDSSEESESVSSFEEDLSSEEERRLLDEEDDSLLESFGENYSHDNRQSKPIKDTGFFNICIRGNKRIVTDTTQCSGCLKRSTDNTSQLDNKKRMKWNKNFSHRHFPVRLFLQDIGYESQMNRGSDNLSVDLNYTNNNNENIAQGTSPNLLKITVNKNNSRICEVEKSSVTNSSNSSTDIKAFKIPLPRLKRPPSRPPKKVIKNSNSTDGSITIPDSIAVETNEIPSLTRPTANNYASHTTRKSFMNDDDAISIVASSIDSDLIRDEPEILREDLRTDVDLRAMNPFETDARISSWVQGTRPSPVPSPGTTTPVLAKHNRSPEENESSDSSGNKIPFRDVPAYFKGLCFFYYINEHCVNKKCNLSHHPAHGKFVYKAQSLKPQDLINNYRFMVDHKLKRLYSAMIKIFIDVFTYHKLDNELIGCIRDFYTFEMHALEILNCVIKGLQKMELTFHESVEKIMMLIGLGIPNFANDLLTLLTAKSDISENWYLIKKIIRTVHISPKLADKILILSTKKLPLDKRLLLDIHEEIVKNKLIDLSQVSKAAWKPFETLVLFNKTSTAAENVLNPSQEVQIYDHRLTANQLHNGINRWRKSSSDSRIKREKRRCDFETGTIITSYDDNSVHSSDIDERCFESVTGTSYCPLGSSSSTASVSSRRSRSASLCSDYFYVPQQVCPPPRRQIPLSSAAKQSEYQLSPSPPVVGKMKLPEDFIFNNSLHYLYPNIVKDIVSLDDNDYVKIKDAVLQMNGRAFLQFLHKYKNPATLERFIINVIINLKKIPKTIVETLRGLLEDLSVVNLDPETMKLIKIVFEVMAMNILIEMEKICCWDQAVKLLTEFSDWDGLASSQMFGTKSLTHMGRYIYLADLFNKGGKYYYSYRILTCTELRLMCSPSTWPFFNNKYDLDSRNNVLDEFLQNGFKTYLSGALQIHKYLLTSLDVYGYNRWQQQQYLNGMLKTMLEDNQISNLYHCVNFMSHFYKVLEADVLRLFAGTVAQRLNKTEKFQIYELCSERNIYYFYTGEESSIVIRTDNSDSEIDLIFNYFFSKRSRICKTVADLNIYINLPENCNLKIFQNRSMVDSNVAVKTILRDNFDILVRESSNITRLEIPAQELSTFLMV